MKKLQQQIIILIALCMVALTAHAQTFQVQEAGAAPLTPENLIYNYFLGSGIEVLDIKYDGPTMSVGYFDNAKNVIGLDRGIVMTTGRVKTVKNGNQMLYGIDAPGNVNADNNNQSTVFDADAAKLTREMPQNVVRYTITFKPSADTLRFRYVFASEEYPEYACRDYNDLFGFFISGPGINGTFEKNGINIAKIPKTDFPVTINNIHPSYAPNSCPDAFVEYYNDNNKSNKMPAFDAFLDVFTAEIAVEPCQTYTIKLVVADIGDKRLDSGVFLDAKSFGTNALRVDVANSTGVEGCSNASVTFNLPNKKSTDLIVPIKVVGGTVTTADYKPLPTAVILKAGENIATLNVEGIKDALTEGSESIAIEYQLNPCKKDTVWLNIKDNELKQPELGADKNICEGESVTLDATVPFEVPSPKSFDFGNAIDINTITAATPNELPTFAEIMVSGITPSFLKADVIESVCFTADHERLEDLDVYLIAPNGKFIELTSDNGGTGKKYQKTCFSPKANTKITDASSPYSGVFLPEGDWNDLWSAGNNPVNGKWKLQIIDDQAGQFGKLLSWSMTFQPLYSVAYEWTPEDGLNCKNCAKVTAKPTKSNTYRVAVMDSYGCKMQDSVKIILGGQLPAPLVTCQEITGKSISFVWQPVAGATDFEVSVNGAAWQPANGGTYSHKVDNLPLGQKVNIQVRAKNKNGKCANGAGGEIGSASCNTPDCLPPTLSLQTLQNESCYNRKDGKIQLKAENGFAPYIYQFENQKNSTGLFVLIGKGAYSASVTDAKGCTNKISFKIDSPMPVTVLPYKEDATCSGTADGKAAIKVGGGTLPYEFSWSNGKKDSLQTNLIKNTYSVTVYDKNGCSTSQNIAIEDKTSLEIPAQTFDIKCHGLKNGAIILSPKGGVQPYLFNWTGTANYTANNQNINDLKPGNYAVTMTDKNGCKVKNNFTITEPKSELKLTVSGSATVCFGDKAHVQAFATGGVVPYQFNWSNGQKGETLDKVLAGNYLLTVSDANGCFKKDSIKIIGLEEIKAEVSVTHASCFNGSGSAEVTSVTLGTKTMNISDFYYKWSNDIASFKNTILKAGQTHTLTITDKMGCSITKTFSIINPPSIGIGIEKIANATCFDAQNGSATVIGIGGTAPYSYLWDISSGGQKTANANNLKAGTYTVWVTDAKGCSTQKDVTIKAPAKLKISFTPRNLACFQDNSGRVESFIVGGTAPYQYEWSTGVKTPFIEKLSVGTYRLTVTDAQGCTVAEQTKLTEPDLLEMEITTTDLNCHGAKNGKIKINPVGGTPPFKFSLEGSPFNGISNIVYLKANVYEVTVKDVRGCLATTEVEIKQPDPIELELGRDTTMEFGDTIQIGIIPKKGFKTKTYQYEWNARDSSTMSCIRCAAPKVFPINSTIYEVKATDEKGCSVKDNISIHVLFTPKVFVPTAFTPNSDGKNDVLMVHGDKDIKVLYFNVYERWGGLVSEAKEYMLNDTNGVWDGTLNGKRLPIGTYIWGMEVLYPTGQKETMKGSIELLR